MAKTFHTHKTLEAPGLHEEAAFLVEPQAKREEAVTSLCLNRDSAGWTDTKHWALSTQCPCLLGLGGHLEGPPRACMGGMGRLRGDPNAIMGRVCAAGSLVLDSPLSAHSCIPRYQGAASTAPGFPKSLLSGRSCWAPLSCPASASAHPGAPPASPSLGAPWWRRGAGLPGLDSCEGWPQFPAINEPGQHGAGAVLGPL